MKVEVVYDPFPPNTRPFVVYADGQVLAVFANEEEAVAHAKEIKKNPPPTKGWRREID